LLEHFERAWAGEVVRFHQELDMTTVKYDTARQETLYLHSTLFAIPVSGGQRTNIVVVQEDITERVRAEQVLRQQSRYLTLLNDITRAALEALDLQSILRTLADRLGELFEADGCYITLWDEEEQKTIPTAAYGELRETYPSLLIEPGETTMTESVLEAGHPLVAEDVFNTPYMSPRIAAQFPALSLMSLPLIANGKKLGAVLIAFNQAHHFSADEIARGEQVAGQIAVAVAKAQLHEQVQRYAEGLEERVRERTAELRKMVNLMAGRELRMAELKGVIRDLRQQLLDAGMTPVADDPLKPPENSIGNVTEE
jgi:GAF domain-containing protein